MVVTAAMEQFIDAESIIKRKLLSPDNTKFIFLQERLTLCIDAEALVKRALRTTEGEGDTEERENWASYAIFSLYRPRAPVAC